ncbi:MAG: glycosyltransferase family 2 protein, partial [Thermoanaerobaculia bacterium]
AVIKRHQAFYRELMGRTFNVIIQILGMRGIRDTQCGFKLLRGSVARRISQRLTTSGFAFDVEFVWEVVLFKWRHRRVRQA